MQYLLLKVPLWHENGIVAFEIIKNDRRLQTSPSLNEIPVAEGTFMTCILQIMASKMRKRYKPPPPTILPEGLQKKFISNFIVICQGSYSQHFISFVTYEVAQ